MNPQTRPLAWLLLFTSLGMCGLAGMTGSVAAQAPPTAALTPATELSEAQKKAIDAILADARAKAGPLTAAVGKGVREVRENLIARKSDEPARQQILQRISGLAAQLVALRINTTARILGILTAEQKDAVEAEEKKVDFKLDVYEVLVKVYSLPAM
jgi:hypothetical protein